MGLLNVGAQALQANMVALQTTGNNIANVNTPGFSRQRAVMATVAGQYTGAGYVGKGVDVQTIARNYDQFLTRQSALATSTQAADVTRSDYLKQLSDIFQGGTTGMGAAINDMLNSFSDVASTPTDLTARTVVLTRVDETARRMRAANQSLDDLQTGITQALGEKISAVNTLATQIAQVNDQIALAQGNGQPPNDLLDKRDQLVRNLNQYVQTTSIKADDGSVGIYLGGSQALVLGSTASTLSLGLNDFGDSQQNKVQINRSGVKFTLDESSLGGGEISGLLRFQNTDLVEGRNLLGRLTTTVTTSMNAQHALGLDLNGKAGGPLFSSVNVNNVLTPLPPAPGSSASAANLTLSVGNASQFVASDYLVNITQVTPGAPGLPDTITGTITRVSDGINVPVNPLNPSIAIPFNMAAGSPVTFDGLTMSVGAANPAVGDRFYLKPFSTAASNITREFSTPSSLAVASPIVGQMGAGNTGSLQLSSLAALTQSIPAAPVTITFGANSTYTRSDQPGTSIYTSGAAITSADWSVTLQGTPQNGDTFTVRDINDPSIGLDRKLNGGNATNMMNLRDVAMFDGAAMSDGYASLISQIGIRSQSANYSATVSTNIATNAEKDRTGVAGVNLDEEAAKLIQYQQAYQASAKMIQIAQSIFDTLIQTLAH
jgi:flagellar hook-associated protein 1 FlgK